MQPKIQLYSASYQRHLIQPCLSSSSAPHSSHSAMHVLLFLFHHTRKRVHVRFDVLHYVRWSSRELSLKVVHRTVQRVILTDKVIAVPNRVSNHTPGEVLRHS